MFRIINNQEQIRRFLKIISFINKNDEILKLKSFSTMYLFCIFLFWQIAMYIVKQRNEIFRCSWLDELINIHDGSRWYTLTASVCTVIAPFRHSTCFQILIFHTAQQPLLKNDLLIQTNNSTGNKWQTFTRNFIALPVQWISQLHHSSFARGGGEILLNCLF